MHPSRTTLHAVTLAMLAVLGGGGGCDAFAEAPGDVGAPPSPGGAAANDAGADGPSSPPGTPPVAEEPLVVAPSGSTTFATANAGEKFIVPDGCTSMAALVWAAGGGAGAGSVAAPGGAAGAAHATFTATPGEQLNVMIGSPGEASGAAGKPNGGLGAAPDATTRGGGGGGMSGIYRFPASPEDQYIVIAGGGGGGGGVNSGGGYPGPGRAGGGYEGEPSTGDADGRSGTQTQSGQGMGGAGSGAALTGGNGLGTPSFAPGGGGAGWYGGGGGGVVGGEVGGGGGGSGYLGRAVVSGKLHPGRGPTPGLEAHPQRGGAGSPGSGGRVLLWCVQ